MDAYLVLDGTLLPIDRITADRPFYSGKHKEHGMNVQGIADPKGRLLWASPALADAVHDVRAAGEHGIIDALAEAGINCWADKGYQGAIDTVRLRYRGRWGSLSAGRLAVNRSHEKVRALVEQAITVLKSYSTVGASDASVGGECICGPASVLAGEAQHITRRSTQV